MLKSGMKKFLHVIHWRYLKHLYHTWGKTLSHKDALRKFLQTKNGRLAVIIIIAAMIPMTVLSVQQVQNLQQEAQSTAKAACDGASTGLLAEPRPAIKGQKVVFKHTEALPPIDQKSFEEWDSFGNGVISSSCKLVGNTIECEARGTAKAGQISKHTWRYRELAVCEYEVKNTAPKSTPTPTKNPNGTPRPTRPGGTTPNPTRPAGGACDAELRGKSQEVLCGANNTPRLRVSWDLRGGEDGKCEVILEQGNSKWILNKDCDNRDGVYVDKDIDGKTIPLKSKTSYKLTAVNGKPSCNAVSEAETADCQQGGGSPTPTQPGGGTNPSSSPAPTTPPGQGGNCKIISQNLSNDCKKLTATFDIPGTTCGYGVQGDEGEIDAGSTSCKRTSNALSIDTYNGKPFVDGGAYRVYVDNGQGCRAKWEGNPTMQCKPPTPTPTPPLAAQSNGRSNGVIGDWFLPNFFNN